MNFAKVAHNMVTKLAGALPDKFEEHYEPIEAQEGTAYRVQSFEGKDENYRVAVVKREDGWYAKCECPGWQYNEQYLTGRKPCKHIVGALLLQKGFNPDEKFPEKPRPKPKPKPTTAKKPPVAQRAQITRPATAITEWAHSYEGLVHPVAPIEAVQQVFQAFQDAKKSLLSSGDVLQAPDGVYIKKSGWRKIAVFFGISLRKVAEGWVEGASTPTWYVTYRATAPGGQYQDATGYCSWGEGMPRGRVASAKEKAAQLVKAKKWSQGYADRHVQGVIAKLEHDVRVTAETRAKNRAISDLVGGGEISAEEIESM